MPRQPADDGGEQLDLFGGTSAATPPRTRDAAAARAGAAVESRVPDAGHVALAHRLPPGLRIGTSSWSFPGWSGIVYDGTPSPARLARSGLQAYARHPLLRTVGLDRNYYAPLTVDDYAAYAAQVPVGFRFLVKAPEVLTMVRYPPHERYGVRRGTQNETFFDAAGAEEMLIGPVCEGLGDTLGVILFQLPPQPAWAVGGRQRFAERLQRFLDALPVGPVYAVELRTAALLGADYAQALASVGAAHCCNVHPTMPDVELQAATVDPAAAPALVVRWMLGGDQRYEAARERYRPFDALVDDDPAARGQPSYCVINMPTASQASCSRCCEAASSASPRPIRLTSCRYAAAVRCSNSSARCQRRSCIGIEPWSPHCAAMSPSTQARAIAATVSGRVRRARARAAEVPRARIAEPPARTRAPHRGGRSSRSRSPPRPPRRTRPSVHPLALAASNHGSRSTRAATASARSTAVARRAHAAHARWSRRPTTSGPAGPRRAVRLPSTLRPPPASH